MKHRGTPRRVALRALCLSCALVSCVTNGRVSGGGYWGTKGAVQGAVEEITELNRKGYLPKAADMNRAVHDMAQSAVEGAVEGALQGAKDRKVGEEIKKSLASALDSTDERLGKMLDGQTPRIETLVGNTVRAALKPLRQELRDATQSDLPTATGLTVREAVDSFAVAMQSEKVDAVQNDLVGMTGRITMTASQNAVIGLRDELSDDKTGKAVGQFARVAVTEATKDFWPQLKAEIVETREKLVAVLVAAVGILVLFVVSLFWLRQKSRALAETERALRFLVNQINEVEGKEIGPIKASIKAEESKAKEAKGKAAEEKVAMHAFLKRFRAANGA